MMTECAYPKILLQKKKQGSRLFFIQPFGHCRCYMSVTDGSPGLEYSKLFSLVIFLTLAHLRGSRGEWGHRSRGLEHQVTGLRWARMSEVLKSSSGRGVQMAVNEFAKLESEFWRNFLTLISLTYWLTSSSGGHKDTFLDWSEDI